MFSERAVFLAELSSFVLGLEICPNPQAGRRHTGRRFAGNRLALAMGMAYAAAMNYERIITIEPGKRGGKPCVRRMRIAVGDVLGWLAAGMTHQEIIEDYPELTEDDIRACLAYAADRERRTMTVVASHEAVV